MKGRIKDEVVNSEYSLADMDHFCLELGDQIYELVFKSAFKGERDNFNAAFKLNLSSLESLMSIIKKWGDASTATSEINAKLKIHITNAIKAGIIKLPADKEEQGQLTRALGNYFRAQLYIAQLKYHSLRYTQQEKPYDKEQGLLAAKKLRQLLPTVINRTADMATAKHSFSLFGMQITHPAIYNEDASELKAVHDALNDQSEKLLKFVDALIKSYSKIKLTGEFHAAESYINAIKTKKSTTKKRIVSADEIYFDKNDMQKKQAVIPAPFEDNSEKTLPRHPVLESALDVRVEMLRNQRKLKNNFAELHKVAAENKESIEITSKAERAANIQVYLHAQGIEQERFAAKLTPKKPGFIQSLKTAFNNFMEKLHKAINIMIVIVLNELSISEVKKPGRNTSSMITSLGGCVNGTSKINDDETKAAEKAKALDEARRALVKQTYAFTSANAPAKKNR